MELQKNTKTLAAPRPAPKSEPVIILKGLLKPDSDPEKPKEEEMPDQVMIDAIRAKRERMRQVGASNHGEADGLSDDEPEFRGRTGLVVADSGKKDLIPDRAMIDAIRAKRERMRQAGAAAPDYIALDGGSNHGEAEGLSDEEPEFRGRIGLVGESGKKGVFEDVEKSVVVEDDEDEEDRIWEEEQFRKAFGKRRDEGVAMVDSGSRDRYVHPMVEVAQYPNVGGLHPGPSIGGFPGSNVMSISQHAEVTRNALRENVMRLKESRGRTLASLSITDDNMSASVLKVTSLEKALSAAGEKFIFMQKLREFVSIICDILQDKGPYIEELEAEMQQLQEQHAASMLERRSADNKDEIIEVEAAINAAMSVFNKGGNTSTMIEVATKAAQAATNATNEQIDLPVKLDEFDRDINLQKQMDITRRADARKRRKAQTDAKRRSSMEIDGPHQRIEGESSTDESDSEIAAYESNKDMLLQTAEQIFSDAADEYSQLSAVMERFESWKKDYPASYQDAYMSLSIPSIFSPYVRLELLKWDPLHKDTDFIDMKWHLLLYNYGIEDEDDISPDDADANLVPQLVEKVAVPILHHAIAQCWDLLSTSETKNAVVAMELVVRYLPSSSKALVELVSVLHDRIVDAIDNLTVPTWSPLVMKVVPHAAHVAAYRFGTSVRLLRNVSRWNKVIALPVLEQLALDELLSGKILPHLRSIESSVHDAITRTERVIASISDVWSGQSVAGHPSPKLQPLVNYLLSLGRTLEKKHVTVAMESETSGLPRRLIKMLVELNEYDHARSISRNFNIKVAL